jgi:hypothetical protein
VYLQDNVRYKIYIMRVLRKGNRDTKSLAYTYLVRFVLEYGSACWDS